MKDGQVDTRYRACLCAEAREREEAERGEDVSGDMLQV